ncbi:MAG: AtpZ/AtpI family protein [Deltaproteobacteria bacterium]|jgi:F0F1-type ATP synthase assembly protein I|nr:AtpZ/AtpI family protein [Deltaproteobacteria bacterium]
MAQTTPGGPAGTKKRRIGVAELKMLAAASSIGIAMVLSVFFGLAAGYWVDGRLGTRPAFILVGLLVGLAAAFNNLIVLSRRLERDRKQFYGPDGTSGPLSHEAGAGPFRRGAKGQRLRSGPARALQEAQPEEADARPQPPRPTPGTTRTTDPS